jgi:hypothetical protein
MSTKNMHANDTQFAICLREDPQGEDLILHKIYRVLPDPAAPAGYLRVVDESGEDYLYSARAFVLVSLPPEVAEKLVGPSLVP